MNIHPSAIVSPDAQIGENVTIGPFAVVEPDVIIGDGCSLGIHSIVKTGTTLGKNNRVEDSAILGGMPQHTNPPEKVGGVVIGDNNVFRENVTVHRSLYKDANTIVGDNNFMMVNAHVAHDCIVGNNIILVNNTMLGGHVTVEDRAFLSGGTAVHQFCRVGAFAMIGGQAHLTREVPPFVMVDGLSSLVVGLNKVGLRRAGLTPEEIGELKQVYRVLYRSRGPWEEILERLDKEFPAGMAHRVYEFCCEVKRGIVGERRLPPSATLKLLTGEGEEADDDDIKTKAG
ncbi:MAG: acyl-ACP--UDP-N-acetylglucosamine O-acyltransferase [Planctomycetia bacterium]